MILALIKKRIFQYRIKFADQYSIIPILRKQGAVIGENCRIYIKHIGEPYLVTIGNHVTISSDARLLTHDGAAWVIRDGNLFLNNFGKIVIHDNCFIGNRAIILPNITVGPNSIVGAGAVVTHDVTPNAVFAGNPAKRICSIEDYKVKVIKNSIPIPENLQLKFKTERDIDNLDKILIDVLKKHFCPQNITD